MNDDVSTAFDMPIARAVATGSGVMCDRIAVRDFVQSVEIGAFQSERGATQRVRFNVVLEVSHSTASKDDDVDKVLSYDTIVEAIRDQLAAERINLLETLAERIAERCLADRRTIRVFVRIEKLDRIPGTLGVEIARARVDLNEKTIAAIEDPPFSNEEERQQVVVFIPNKLVDAGCIGPWLDAIDALDAPAVIALEMLPGADHETGAGHLISNNPMVARRLRLLSVEQNAWVLAGLDPRCVVVETRTELEHAARVGEMSVWAPSKIVLDSLSKPESGAGGPRRLALWFAKEIGARSLVILGEDNGLADADYVQAVSLDDPAALAGVKC